MPFPAERRRLAALPCTLVGWGRLAIIAAVAGALIWRLVTLIPAP